jgi:hypothetical protein
MHAYLDVRILLATKPVQSCHILCGVYSNAAMRLIKIVVREALRSRDLTMMDIYRSKRINNGILVDL